LRKAQEARRVSGVAFRASELFDGIIPQSNAPLFCVTSFRKILK
jgi:hypothetical protein